MLSSTSDLIVSNEPNQQPTQTHTNTKLNNSKLKRIRIKDDAQLLGAIYNCLLRHDSDNEGLVCLNENIGFFLNYTANDKDSARFNKLEPGNLIPSNVYIQPKKFGSLSQWYFALLYLSLII